MDRLRPSFDRQKSLDSPIGSPVGMSPLNRHVRSSSSGLSNLKKPQNVATKAAAQRLARVMAQGGDDDDEDEDDLLVDYNPTGSLGLAAGRSAARPRSRSPSKSVRLAVKEQPTSVRTPMITRPSFSAKTNDQQSSRPSSASLVSPSPIRTQEQTETSALIALAGPSPMASLGQMETEEAQSMLSGRPALSVRTEGPTSARSNSGLRSSLSVAPSEQPPSARSAAVGRSPLAMSSSDGNIAGRYSMASGSAEQPPSARSTSSGRPSVIKTVPIVPSAVTISLKQPTPSSPAPGARSYKRMSLDMGSMRIREPKESNNQPSSTALQDELEMLQEENDNLLDKLRLAEDRLQETEARAKQLEKQVANLGEGVSMEARLLNRKEAVLQQREAALRVASQTHGGSMGEIATLRIEAEAAREEANSALDQLRECETELRTLRSMAQRLMLTQEELEEVVLKRCWLARYWGLCVRYGNRIHAILNFPPFHRTRVCSIESTSLVYVSIMKAKNECILFLHWFKGIYPDIAETKHEFWSSYAPLPVEVVTDAGQKAKDDSQSVNIDQAHGAGELSGEGSAENMLIVEKGLRELAVLKRWLQTSDFLLLLFLKVEDAVRIAMAQQRRKNMQKPIYTDDLRSPSQKFAEAFELSQEEVEEVQFKQAWLLYFWRRAKNHGVELDIADERLRFWISHSARASTSHDAVDVERGLFELRKLGLETQLWEETRKWTQQDTRTKSQTGF